MNLEWALHLTAERFLDFDMFLLSNQGFNVIVYFSLLFNPTKTFASFTV